jgi:hypothetical protein
MITLGSALLTTARKRRAKPYVEVAIGSAFTTLNEVP